MPKLSIVAPMYNHLDLAQQCIYNIKEVCRDIDYEFIVINDGSPEKEVGERLEQQEWIILLNNTINWWVTKVRNEWVEKATWDYICVINNDVIFPEFSFQRLMEWFDLHPEVIMVNPRFTEWYQEAKWKWFKTEVMYYKNHICWHCYMFKKENRDKLFPIPLVFRIFWNDNRLTHHIQELWYKQLVKHDVILHHMKSQTVFSIKNEDLSPYLKMCKEKWWTVPVVFPLPTDNLESDFIF